MASDSEQIHAALEVDQENSKKSTLRHFRDKWPFWQINHLLPEYFYHPKNVGPLGAALQKR